MTTSTTVFTVPDDDALYLPQIPTMIAWAEGEGLDARTLVRDGFRIDREADGTLVLRCQQFDLDAAGHRIVDLVGDDGATYRKHPLEVRVSSVPVLRGVAA